MRSIVGVGMTPPNVLGTPKPESSVMMSKMLGAPLGGTMRGAHQAFDWRAPSLITPPNFGSAGGSCFPLMVVVAPGEPGVPVVCICALAEGATAMTAAANIPPRRMRLSGFIFLFLVGLILQILSFRCYSLALLTNKFMIFIWS